MSSFDEAQIRGQSPIRLHKGGRLVAGGGKVWPTLMNRIHSVQILLVG